MNRYELRETIKKLIEQIQDKDKLVDEIMYLFYEEEAENFANYLKVMNETIKMLSEKGGQKK